MSSSFYSQQHRRRLDDWRIEQAWRLLWAELARVVADADRALHDATRTLRESERTGQTMVGGTGGPLENDNGGKDNDNGMRTEICSICDGDGEYWFLRKLCRCATCGGTGRITYRSAARAAADAEQAQRDSTLELVKRQRDAMATKNNAPATFTAEEQARLRFHRYLAEQTAAYEEDR